MFNIAIAFAYQPAPKTNNIAIITNAGGPGVLTTDAAIHDGLKLAAFSEETTAILKKNLPKTANIKNPVDVIGDARADRYNIALTSAFNDPAVDAVFVILTPQSMTDIDLIAREVAKVSSHYKKPVYASFMGAADVQEGIDVLQRNKIPHYSLPESMSKAVATVYKFNQEKHDIVKKERIFNDLKPEIAKTILNNAIAENIEYLTEETALKVLGAYGLPVLESYLASTPNEASQYAARIGFPVVMKVMSEDIVHKFDVGGVVLNIQNDEEVRIAYNVILKNVQTKQPDAIVKGVLVTKMISSGEEVILGLKRDLSFNSVIMFGLGGIFVEIFKDVSFRIAPVDEISAKLMINEIKSSAILKGARGKAVSDIQSIVESIMRLSKLATDCPQIKELDINPLIVLEEGKGCYIADAKIMLSTNSK